MDVYLPVRDLVLIVRSYDVDQYIRQYLLKWQNHLEWPIPSTREDISVVIWHKYRETLVVPFFFACIQHVYSMEYSKQYETPYRLRIFDIAERYRHNGHVNMLVFRNIYTLISDIQGTLSTTLNRGYCFDFSISYFDTTYLDTFDASPLFVSFYDEGELHVALEDFLCIDKHIM